MPKVLAGVGDAIEVVQHHWLAGATGKVVAMGDNTCGEINQIHILFDRDDWRLINRNELWLGNSDIVVLKKALSD